MRELVNMRSQHHRITRHAERVVAPVVDQEDQNVEGLRSGRRRGQRNEQRAEHERRQPAGKIKGGHFLEGGFGRRMPGTLIAIELVIQGGWGDGFENGEEGSASRLMTTERALHTF